jgi:predicted HicB family RNase H-like nuclease
MIPKLHHKGLQGSIAFNPEDGVFHGRLVDVRDLVTYEAPDRNGLEQAFCEAVDDYLAGDSAGKKAKRQTGSKPIR